MVNYHKQGRGRPVENKAKKNPNDIKVGKSSAKNKIGKARLSATDEFKLKQAYFLRGGDGSVDCPIDIMCAQRLITKEQAEAAKVYGLIWGAAFGKPRRYSGNVWAGIIDGFGREVIDTDMSMDAQAAKRDRYNKVDKILASYGPEVRSCLRGLCEGHLPYYFRDCIFNASKTYTLDVELEKVEGELKEILNSKDKKSKDKYKKLFERRQVILKKLEVFSNEKEPAFNIYIRGELKLALNGLAREFGIFS